MASVMLDGVKKVYANGTTAVDNFNLSIDDGELVVLVGPSGCGKSSVLRMIAGLEEISEGTLLINGKRMNDVSPVSRNIAMVFQNYALYPHMTVRKNIELSLKLRRMPKSDRKVRVQETAEMLGLTDVLERRPAQLSGGQRQRVAMGRAIVRDPSVFLLDEPLSNLDAKLRAQVRGDISELQKRLSATMVFVTHDQIEAMTMADRIVVMRDGQLQQVGSPDELYGSPKNLFVADFIGSPAMNFLQGCLTIEGGLSIFHANGGLRWVLPQNTLERNPHMTGRIGKPVVFGVRPEHLSIAMGNSNSLGIPGVIKVIEPLGGESIIHAEVNASIFNKPTTKVGVTLSDDGAAGIYNEGNRARFIAKVQGNCIFAEGENVIIYLRDDAPLYFFDVDTSNAVSQEDERC